MYFPALLLESLFFLVHHFQVLQIQCPAKVSVPFGLRDLPPGVFIISFIISYVTRVTHALAVAGRQPTAAADRSQLVNIFGTYRTFFTLCIRTILLVLDVVYDN